MGITYKQAHADHKYLWDIAPAYDMTGGYVDQDDLQKLLDSPTKATARGCLISQIEYWFGNGPDISANYRTSQDELRRLLDVDERVKAIAKRYGC